MAADEINLAHSSHFIYGVDPELSEEQKGHLALEVARVEQIYTSLLSEQPLDFSLSSIRKASASKTSPVQMSAQLTRQKKREFIFLMKEIVDVRTV